MDEEIRPLLATGPPRVSIVNHVGDFFNTLKAFIGTNYLALPFAFMQSGVAFGIAGVFFIATLTDHCCQLLVKCKYYVIDLLVEEEQLQRHLSDSEKMNLVRRLERDLGYGDLGRIAFGSWCHKLIQVAVGFTQYTTCICYFIFIGNTIFTIFPLVPEAFAITNATVINSSDSIDVGPASDFLDAGTLLGEGVPLLRIENVDRWYKTRHSSHLPATHATNGARNVSPCSAMECLTTPASIDIVTTSSDNVTMVTYDTNMTTLSPNVTTVRPSPTWTPIPSPRYIMTSSAPDLRLLVLIPLPFFICTSMVRRLRLLSPLTFIATIALFFGAFFVMIFLSFGFVLSDDYEWYKFTSLPLFVGQLTSAYEGIGCVLPIQSSMEGNRPWFPAFLHSSIYIVFAVLTAFGTLGYMRYGENVQQIILLSIPQHSVLAIAVDAMLILSVLCTYPLQCFPIIDIFENALFTPGHIFGPRVDVHSGNVNALEEERQGLLSAGLDGVTSMEASIISTASSEVALEVPKTVAGWKRNLMRLILTLSIVTCAVFLRDAYALVAAFTGAVGCSLLAYILPCMIHLKIRQNELPWGIIIKDWLIIIGSIIASLMVIVIIIIKIVNHSIQF